MRSSSLASHHSGSPVNDGGGLLRTHKYHMDEGCQEALFLPQDLVKRRLNQAKRETEILKGETPVRMLLNVSIPHELFNTAVYSDIAGTTMAKFISCTSRC